MFFGKLTPSTKNELIETGILFYKRDIDVSFLQENNLSASFLMNRAYEYLEKGKTKLARSDFYKIIEINAGKKNCEDLSILYSAYINTKQIEKALETISKKMHCPGSFGIAGNYQLRAQLYIKVNKLDKALQDYDSMVFFSERKMADNIERAEFKMNYLKDYKSAKTDLQTVLKEALLNPVQSYHGKEQGYFYLALAEYHLAEKKLAYQDWLTSVELPGGSTDNARINANYLIKKHPKDAEPYLLRGILNYDKSFYLNDKEKKQSLTNAIKDLDQAGKRGLKDPKVNFYKAKILYELKKYEEALQEINKTMPENEKTPKYNSLIYDIKRAIEGEKIMNEFLLQKKQKEEAKIKNLKDSIAALSKQTIIPKSPPYFSNIVLKYYITTDSVNHDFKPFPINDASIILEETSGKKRVFTYVKDEENYSVYELKITKDDPIIDSNAFITISHPKYHSFSHVLGVPTNHYRLVKKEFDYFYSCLSREENQFSLPHLDYDQRLIAFVQLEKSDHFKKICDSLNLVITKNYSYCGSRSETCKVFHLKKRNDQSFKDICPEMQELKKHAVYVGIPLFMYPQFIGETIIDSIESSRITLLPGNFMHIYCTNKSVVPKLNKLLKKLGLLDEIESTKSQNWHYYRLAPVSKTLIIPPSWNYKKIRVVIDELYKSRLIERVMMESGGCICLF